MPWWDFYKLWTYSFERGPIEKAGSQRDLTGAGHSQGDAVPDIRSDGSFWGGGQSSTLRLRESGDAIDLTSVTSRNARYKEYTRLRNVAEIESAMTVIADEACVAGYTKIATVFHLSLIHISEPTRPY